MALPDGEELEPGLHYQALVQTPESLVNQQFNRRLRDQNIELVLDAAIPTRESGSQLEQLFRFRVLREMTVLSARQIFSISAWHAGIEVSYFGVTIDPLSTRDRTFGEQAEDAARRAAEAAAAAGTAISWALFAWALGGLVLGGAILWWSVRA